MTRMAYYWTLSLVHLEKIPPVGHLKILPVGQNKNDGDIQTLSGVYGSLSTKCVALLLDAAGSKFYLSWIRTRGNNDRHRDLSR